MRSFCVLRAARLTLIGLLVVELVMLIVTCVFSFEEVDANLEFGLISRSQGDWKKFLIVLLVFTDFAVIFTGIVGAALQNLLLVAVFALISLGGDIVLIGLNIFAAHQYVSVLDIIFSSLISGLAIYLTYELRRRKLEAANKATTVDSGTTRTDTEAAVDSSRGDVRIGRVTDEMTLATNQKDLKNMMTISSISTKSGKAIYDSVEID